jgi:hypothetical protein
VLALGDTQYNDARPEDYAGYDSAWGRFKAITRTTVGNHEYRTPGAAGYFGYFGAAAGDPRLGYYSFDAGSWHIVSLNSECGQVSCSASSAQAAWLRADLRAHPAACTLAIVHKPLFASSRSGLGSTEIRPLWQILYDEGAELVLDGHLHHYERFAPQTPAGVRDEARGIREITVGTGGVALGGFGPPAANSEARYDGGYGVLALTLRPTAYDWQFAPSSGGTYGDSGTGICH